MRRSVVLVQSGVGIQEPDEIFPRVTIFSVAALKDLSVICVYQG